METVIGTIAGALTSISMLPQLIKVIKEKEVQPLSPTMIIVLMAGVALWVVYGIMKSEWPIIISNSFSFLVNGLLLIYYYILKE
ncbi:SemiSWEET transporter [Sphingobacterium paucimobilis]|uniref:MtN3 and saliva related transmembrane protein n=1 Tax=Sphingobacterium paucimobilis HER1398 TaxID=1346330 RepID=U2HUW0_9SPHI|nr:SemiSWEET transporter [Sphingobacterium paucimobilis]ERJ59312.1 hypothetical protein M472_11055 [Sphingobacterium paucimobilis HER1398]